MTLTVTLPATFLARDVEVVATFLARDVEVVAIPRDDRSFAIKARDAVGNAWPVHHDGIALDHCALKLRAETFEALGVKEGARLFATPVARF